MMQIDMNNDDKVTKRELEEFYKSYRPPPPAGTKGFSPVRIRWVVERSNAWHNRCRRNSKDYERRTDSSEAMLKINHMRIMLRRLAPVDAPTFGYQSLAA